MCVCVPCRVTIYIHSHMHAHAATKLPFIHPKCWWWIYECDNVHRICVRLSLYTKPRPVAAMSFFSVPINNSVSHKHNNIIVWKLRVWLEFYRTRNGLKWKRARLTHNVLFFTFARFYLYICVWYLVLYVFQILTLSKINEFQSIFLCVLIILIMQDKWFFI